MTREQLWANYCRRKPALEDDDASPPVSSRFVRLLFEQTWEIAEDAGRKAAREELTTKDTKDTTHGYLTFCD